MQFYCAKCGTPHDASELEPTFDAPLAYYQVPEAERAHRTFLTSDKCGVRDAADTSRQYFLRVVMPVPIRGDGRPCSWGVWVEVAPEVLKRSDQLWDDPAQGNEPRLPARLANGISEYPGSLGLKGSLQLVDPSTRPVFYLDPNNGHQLHRVQAEGVWPETVIEWIVARHG